MLGGDAPPGVTYSPGLRLLQREEIGILSTTRGSAHRWLHISAAAVTPLKARGIVLCLVVSATAGCTSAAQPSAPTMPRTARHDQNAYLLTPTPIVISADIPPVAPSPRVTIDWAATSAKATTGTPGGSDPTATLTVVNQAPPAVVFDYDVFVSSSDPGLGSGRVQPSAYSSLSGGIWDWRQSGSGRAAPPDWAIVSGSTSNFFVNWPRTGQDGSAVPNGMYFLVVIVTFNGLPSGSAEAEYALS